MTAVMWKYSQVVWAYFILDAATLVTVKMAEIPEKNFKFRIQVDDAATTFNNSQNNFVKNITHNNDSISRLGLFVAPPLNIQNIMQKNTDNPDYLSAQNRYAKDYNLVASSSETRFRGIRPASSSLFAKVDPKNRSERKGNELPRAKGSDRFLTPEFYKFKTEIEKETDETHIRGINMSPDASAASTIIHDRPAIQFNDKFNFQRPSGLIREETFINPYVYDEPYSYEDGPSVPYAKPVSYQQYSSIPKEPYYPQATGGGYYEPPTDYTFPYTPTVNPEPFYYPRPEQDTYNKYTSDSGYDDFPSVYPSPPIPSINYHDNRGFHPSGKNREVGGENEQPEDGNRVNDEDDFDKDFPSSERPPKTPKKHRNPHYEVSEHRSYPIETNTEYSRNSLKNPKPRKKPRKPHQKERPTSEDEDEEFDSNYETPDAFQEDKEENLDADDSTEDEPPKLARLQSPSRKQIKRIQSRPSRAHKKRCVKKRKEMSVEAEMNAGGFDEEPSKKMTCLVCENLDTGGTYETCSYESDPKKKSYYAGNEASYRKGNSKNPYKYRMRRQTLTIINSSLPMKHIVRRSYNADSIGSFSSSVDDFGSDDFTEDENEDQQEDDDDDMEEYKPSLPAYANEDACTEVSKNGLTCTVCHNPETNGKYKQCSYANDPDKNNYEYAQSSSYGSKDVPYNSRHRRQPNKQNVSQDEKIRDTISKETKVPSDWKQLRNIEQKKIGAINDNFQKLIRMKKEQPDSDILASEENPSYEEQFLTLFPELNGEHSSESLIGEHSLLKELNEKPSFSSKGSSFSSKDSGLPGFSSKNKIGGYLKKKSILDDDDEDTEMSKMMKEFKTKDRSACKKTTKDKMTCYICDDKDGIKREECMYIAETEPTKVSYSESSQTKTPDENQAKSSHKREVYIKTPARTFKYKYIPSFELKDQPAVGSMIHKTVSDKSRKYLPSHKPKTYSNVKIHTEKTYSLKALPNKIGKRALPRADAQEQQALGSNRKQRYRKRKSNRDSDDESEDPEENGEHSASEVVPEVDPSSPDGLFSDETREIYSPEMKVSLPKYMLEKSEHEKIVDDFMSKM